MSIIIAILGMLCVLIVILDALETVILPRRVTRPLRLSRLFYVMTWRPWRAFGRRISSAGRREGILSFYGPVSLLMLLGVWAIGLVIGFALLHKAAEGDEAGAIWHYLYYSGSNFFTLGLGSAVPNTALDRIMVVVEGATGFSFLGLVITYLPVLYQAFSQREIYISLLDARAGSPPTAIEFMKRHCHGGQPVNFDRFFFDWERWAAEILESHLSYSMVGHFRSQHENESWVSALTMVLDVAALVMSSFEEPVSYSAQMAFAIARHAAVDLAQVYHTEPVALANDRLLPLALTQLRELLGTRQFSEEKLKELRALYEPYVNALSMYFLMPLPTWTADHKVSDNWRTTAWDNLDGTVQK